MAAAEAKAKKKSSFGGWALFFILILAILIITALQREDRVHRTMRDPDKALRQYAEMAERFHKASSLSAKDIEIYTRTLASVDQTWLDKDAGGYYKHFLAGKGGRSSGPVSEQQAKAMVIKEFISRGLHTRNFEIADTRAYSKTIRYKINAGGEKNISFNLVREKDHWKVGGFGGGKK